MVGAIDAPATLETFKSSLGWSLLSRHAHPNIKTNYLPPAYTGSATPEPSK